jgi:hypothetical protein
MQVMRSAVGSRVSDTDIWTERKVERSYSGAVSPVKVEVERLFDTAGISDCAAAAAWQRKDLNIEHHKC